MVAALPARSTIGATLGGRYTIERELAGGGMGQVLVARHRELGIRVAIKLLRADRVAEPVSVERFRREARAASRIRGEHVARVLDVGDSDEHGPFIVMEYVVGRSLAAALAERGPFDVATATSYVLQACEALADAHRLGIVHRDLKPSNLLLTEAPDGTELVKVTDFGIAKVPAATNVSTLTEAAGVLGSPRYMSPEQILDPRTVDARSDLWSLGVVLYELVSRRVPFEAYTTSGVLARIASESASPLRSHVPSIAPEFEAVVMRCLEKARDARFATVSDLAEALGPFARGGADAAARVRRIGEARESASLPAPPIESEPAGDATSAQLASSLTAAPTEQPVVRRPRGIRIASGPVARLLVVVAGIVLVGAVATRTFSDTKAPTGTTPVAARVPNPTAARVPEPTPSSVGVAPAPTSPTWSAEATTTSPLPSASVTSERSQPVAKAISQRPPTRAVAAAHSAGDIDFGPRK